MAAHACHAPGIMLILQADDTLADMSTFHSRRGSQNHGQMQMLLLCSVFPGKNTFSSSHLVNTTQTGVSAIRAWAFERTTALSNAKKIRPEAAVVWE